MNRIVVTVVVLFLVAGLIVSSAMSITSVRSERGDASAVQPLADAAQTFPVPANSRVAFPDASNPDLPEIVKGWSTTGTLDEACAAWRESYRVWLGVQQQAQVQGEVTPGVSCSFAAPRGGYQTSLVVAVYGSAEPQATLRVWSA